ncbi:hypothetical protein MP638_001330 [Amoeboaphelidium occidentale]|nr:hypothetical protein MP638_001330 [Amoeboaphelidium occidentale]
MYEVHGKVILTEKTKPDVIKLKEELLRRSIHSFLKILQEALILFITSENEGTRILKYKTTRPQLGSSRC